MYSFATTTANGVLLYNGQYDVAFDHVVLRLVGGVPRFEYSLGDGNVVVVAVDDVKENRVNDGRWRTVVVEYDEKVSD